MPIKPDQWSQARFNQEQEKLGVTPVAYDPFSAKKGVNQILGTEGARVAPFGGGRTVSRILPSGTTLRYDVLKQHPDGMLTVRPIAPEGYPQAKSFKAPASAFSDTKKAKPYKK